MAGMVDVTIPVGPEAAAALADTTKREAIGGIVSRLLRPVVGDDPLLDAMGRLGADATARGLTPQVLDAELAAHKAERRRWSSSMPRHW